MLAVTTFAMDKYSGLFDKTQKGSIMVILAGDKEGEALGSVSSSIHGISFCGLSMQKGT
jgi:hypothetical protein